MNALLGQIDRQFRGLDQGFSRAKVGLFQQASAFFLVGSDQAHHHGNLDFHLRCRYQDPFGHLVAAGNAAKMLTKIDLTLRSLRMILSDAATFSAVAPPPMSRN